jgi:YYY domain-containing protein
MTSLEPLLALRWYLALQVFGIAALPLTLRLFRRMPGRGYAFARPLGLLIAGWAFWLFSIFGWLPNTAGAIVAVLALLAVAGLALWLRPSSEETDAAPLPRGLILTVEVLFAAAFALWCLVRAYMPRIETAGGEKWMEIAFLNAVLRAPRFPPHDPWLSGYAISYYYFGYVMMGMLSQLAAVPSTIAFNLGIATLFALTVTSAYGLVYALLARMGESVARWGAFWGPLTVAIVGNLEGLLEVFHARGLFPAAFWKWLDIRSINVPPPFAGGSWMPTRFMWWWQASRVLHDYAPWHTPAGPAEWEVIDEFPAFSFILGDMHPHLLSLPFVLLVLALALNLFFALKGKAVAPRRLVLLGLRGWEFFLYALCLGGLGFLNTWDFPIYAVVLAFSFLLAHWRSRSLISLSTRLLSFLPAFILAFLLYLPFWISLRSQAAGILPNLFNPTRLPQFLVMFGPLLFPVAVWTAVRAREAKVRLGTIAFWGLVLILGLTAFLIGVIFIHPEGRTYLAAWRSGGPIPGLEHVPDARRLIGQRLLARFLFPWTALLLALMLSAALATLFSRRPSDSDGAPENAYLLILVAIGAALPLAVEFIYLRDLFGTRMNTVFKFYFQAWTMWGIAAAYALALLVRRGPRWAAAVGTILSWRVWYIRRWRSPRVPGSTAVRPPWMARPICAPSTPPI